MITAHLMSILGVVWLSTKALKGLKTEATSEEQLAVLAITKELAMDEANALLAQIEWEERRARVAQILKRRVAA